MTNLIEIIGNLAKFDSYEVPGLGTVNIKKPGLVDIDRVEELEKRTKNPEAKSSEEIKATSKMIAIDFVVNDEAEPIFNEDNIDVFTNMPLEYQIDVILVFRETFQKINTKSEELKKKQ